MSFFDEENKDAMTVAPEQAATTPRVGFLDAFENSYNAQVRGSAMYGIENEIQNVAWAQNKKLRDAGVPNADIPQLVGPSMSSAMEIARFYEDGGDPETAKRFQDFDTRIDSLRQKHPGVDLLTSREIWGDVKSKAQMYEEKNNTYRTTTGGAIGGFVGAAIGGLNPYTDPLNAATLGVGGGATALGRIAFQGAAQGVTETANQLLGVQEERRLLGLEHGTGDALVRIAGAAVSGVVAQGLGEGVVAGARRFFRSTPKDVASPPGDELISRPALPDTSAIPPGAIPADETLAAAKLTREPQSFQDYVNERSPFAQSRAGKARSVIDMDYVSKQLDDWEGPRPWEMPPKTDTMVLPGQVAGKELPTLDRFVEGAQVDSHARLIDPDTFAKYDELANRKQVYKRWIDELDADRKLNAGAEADVIDQKISTLQQQAEQTGGKRAAKIRKDIAALHAEKAAVYDKVLPGDNADKARVRQQLLRDDEKMRDLAPLVSRAYARARGKWVNTEADRIAVHDMIRQGRTEVGIPPEQKRVADAVEQAMSDKAPILRSATRPDVKAPANASPLDVAAAVAKADGDVISESLDRFRSSLTAILKPEGDSKVLITGVKDPIDIDQTTVYVPHETGDGGREVTLRELLQEAKDSETELQAVSACSLRKTL